MESRVESEKHGVEHVLMILTLFDSSAVALFFFSLLIEHWQAVARHTSPGCSASSSLFWQQCLALFSCGGDRLRVIMPAVGRALFRVSAVVAACVDRSGRCRLNVLHQQAVNRHSVHPTLFCGLISLASIKRTFLCATARLLHADAGPQRLLLLDSCPCECWSAERHPGNCVAHNSQPDNRFVQSIR